MDIVSVKKLCKSYPKFKLDNASFKLQEGQITGFIGRNGAGKTTTIKSMLNLIHPDSGEIDYFGMPLIGNESAIKSRIGYSTGTISWYPRKKLSQIVDIMKLFYDSWDVDSYEKYRQLFDIDDCKTPLELSDGMKVKSNLLLALSHRAEVLILDEPTSALDAFSRDELLDIFTALKNDGVAIFFSTHIISDIEKCADNIIYISDGRIVSSSPKDEFINKFSEKGETIEQTFLRLERGAHDD